MSTRNIVPRSDGEGGIGTATKRWGDGQFVTINGFSPALTLGHGQCRLTLSGANLLLSPCNGNRIVIDDTPHEIPAAGISLAPTGLTPLSVYYIYAYIVSGVMVLWASTTGYASDSRNGIMVKSGDAARTLVGLAKTNASGAWVDSVAQRFVLSWYNRKMKLCSVTGSCVTTDSTEFTQIGYSIEFLSWADACSLSMNYSITNKTTSNSYATLGIFDASGNSVYTQSDMLTQYAPCSSGIFMPIQLSESSHVFYPKGKTQSGQLYIYTYTLTSLIQG